MEDLNTEDSDSMLISVRTRRLARAAALRVMYSLDSLGKMDAATVTSAIAAVVAPVGDEEADSLNDSVSFCEQIVAGALKSLLEVDRLVQQSSENWTLSRICRVDRNILRLAVYELSNCPDTPISVIINEAVEIAKQYSAPDSSAFINGVLDHAARSIRGVPVPVKVAS